MGDTGEGSWGSRELGGFMQREEARKQVAAPERWQVVVQVIGPDEEAVLESIYTYDSKEDAMEAAMKANEGIDAA